MSNPHPKSIGEGPVKRLIDSCKEIFREIFSKEIAFIRKVKHKFLMIKNGGAAVVDYDQLPDDRKEDYRHEHRADQLTHTGGTEARESRYDTYRTDSATRIAERASENPYIFSDIISDPSLVDADSETGAVAKVASENPGWAKMSDAVETYGIDVDRVAGDGDGEARESGEGESSSGDGNSGESTSPGASGDGDGGSMSPAEAASQAASFDGTVSTADAGDLGPTGASGYGINTGSSGSTGSGTGMGGGAGGGDVGGGDL